MKCEVYLFDGEKVHQCEQFAIARCKECNCLCCAEHVNHEGLCPDCQEEQDEATTPSEQIL